MPDGGGTLWIADTIPARIQGDVNEHRPPQAIPLQAEVPGLGASTSVGDGELTCQRNDARHATRWTCQASDGGIRARRSRDGGADGSEGCFSGDAPALEAPERQTNNRALPEVSL
ncbi:MAG: hypothetical protein RLZZ124_1567 [Cyanobacteriota bacterium]